MNSTEPDTKQLAEVATANCLAFHSAASLLYNVTVPPPPELDGPAQALLHLAALFPTGSKACLASKLKGGATSWVTETADPDLRGLRSTQGIYFKVNRVVRPGTGPNGGVADTDCGTEYALCEMDDASVDSQSMFWAAAMSVGFPVVSLVSSGDKSLHAIVRVYAPDRESYTRQVSALFRVLDRFGPDPTCINNSRYTRLAGGRRGNTGRVQTLLYLNPDAPAWTPDLECNTIIREISEPLPPLPDDGKKGVGHGPRDARTEEEKIRADRAFKAWRSQFRFTGVLNMQGFLEALNILTVPAARLPNGESRFFITCPWAHEHTKEDGLLDCYIYERNTPVDFKWGFHCSHKTCRNAGRNITGVLDLFHQNHLELFEAYQESRGDLLSSEFTTLEDGEEDVPVPGSGELVAGGPKEKHIAELFAAVHGGRICYIHDEEKWLYRESAMWLEDRTEHRCRKANELITNLAARAADARTAGHFITAAGSSQIDSMLKCARKDVRVSTSSDQFDADPWLFGCANGVINLRTGELEPYRAGHHIRKHSPYFYRGLKDTNKEWEEAMQENHKGRPGVADFLQRFFGYAMTGSVKERVMLIFTGNGSNGKTMTIGNILATMGQYGDEAPKEILMSNPRGDNPAAATPALAAMKGLRLVSLAETAAGTSLDDGKLKEFIKDQKVKARNLYEGYGDGFMVEAKGVLSTNHLPRVTAVDDGTWDRLLLVRFLRDYRREGTMKPALKLLLENARDSILAWLVRGCLAYQEKGLNPPQCVLDDTRAYRLGQDQVSMFLLEYTQKGPDERIRRSELYSIYRVWASDAGVGILSKSTFNARMEEKNYALGKYQGDVCWQGIKLVKGEEVSMFEGFHGE